MDKVIIFVPTGEIRPAQKGENYLSVTSGGVGTVKRYEIIDHYYTHPTLIEVKIYKRVEVAKEEIDRFISEIN